MLELRPSLEELVSRLKYCPDTGNFFHLTTLGGTAIGSIAGNINTNGHIQIMINEKNYMAHNLAWLYMTGEWPENFIVDHSTPKEQANNK